MNKYFFLKLTIFSLCLLFFASFCYKVHAAAVAPITANVYIQLSISETKTASGDIQFSLQDAKILYGDYNYNNSALYTLYDKNNPPTPGYNYILSTYNGDAAKTLINQYVVPSSRFTLWDGQDSDGNGTGGINEVDSGTIDAVIPYGAYYIKINNNGVSTDFMPLPVKDLATQLLSVNFCKRLNQLGQYGVDTCCSGLIPAEQEDGSFVCVSCGDGVCSQYEDYRSCPEDCSVAPALKSAFSKPTFLAAFQKSITDPIVFWTIIFLLVVILIFVIGKEIYINTRKKL